MSDDGPCNCEQALELQKENERLRDALRRIRDISADRQRFVLLGPRGFIEAERIAKEALGED